MRSTALPDGGPRRAFEGPLGGLLARRWSAGPVLAGGLLFVVAGAVVPAFTTVQPALVLVGATLLGIGAGAAIQDSSAVATAAVDAEAASISTALNSTIRRFAGGIGAQVSTILLAASGGASRTPRHGGFVLTFAVLAGLAPLGVVAGIRVPR